LSLKAFPKKKNEPKGRVSKWGIIIPDRFPFVRGFETGPNGLTVLAMDKK
jgi:hypothetical protein